MINFTNIQRYDNVPFEEYLQRPGYSHSFLKSEVMGITPMFIGSEKVMIGKLVDGILMDPASVDMTDPLYPVSKVIAVSIRAKFGSMIERFESQLSYTADLEHEGFIMPAKFRLDWLLRGFGVIDLKVTQEKDIHALIRHMGYDNQLWGYARVAEVQKKYILAQRCKKLADGRVIPLGEAQLIKLPDVTPSNPFWADKILKFGRVVA